MTAKAVLCLYLLEGRVLNVSNCFKEIGLSNIGREIPRMVEEPFGVIVSRVARAGKNRYNQPVSYTDYRLNASDHNLEGIEKMREYCKDHGVKFPSSGPSIVEYSKKLIQQTKLF